MITWGIFNPFRKYPNIPTEIFDTKSEAEARLSEIDSEMSEWGQSNPCFIKVVE